MFGIISSVKSIIPTFFSFFSFFFFLFLSFSFFFFLFLSFLSLHLPVAWLDVTNFMYPNHKSVMCNDPYNEAAICRVMFTSVSVEVHFSLFRYPGFRIVKE